MLLHILLTGRPPPRIDPGFIGFVLWTAVVALLANAVGFVAQGAPNAPPEQLLPRFLLVAVGGGPQRRGRPAGGEPGQHVAGERRRPRLDGT